MNIGNIKAHFRKASSYKALGDYKQALDVAEEAFKQARNQNKTLEVIS